LLLFFIVCSRALRHLPSFPTRRSSDLASARLPQPGGLSSPVAKGARTSKLRSGNWVPIYGCCLLKTPKAWVNSTFPTRALQGKRDRKSTRLNSSHSQISYAVFCLKKKK